MGFVRIITLLTLGFLIGATCWLFKLIWKINILLKKIEYVENLCAILSELLDFCSEQGKDFKKVGYCFTLGHQSYNFNNTTEYIFFIVTAVNEIKDILGKITPFEKECLNYCTKNDIENRKNQLVFQIEELVEKLNK